MKKIRQAAAVAAILLSAAAVSCYGKENEMKEEHYTFELNENTERTAVAFKNRFGITLAGDLYKPKNSDGKSAAVAVCGPFGAVKEQVSGFYANQLASRGLIALAFDPSFTGESGGEPRYMNSPDINTEDFSAAVDFLSVRDDVDPEKIGILGICGWGGMALNAAAADTRIKATVSSTMNNQRTQDYKNGTVALAGGVVDPLPEEAPQFVKDYYAYYKTPRGYHERSLNSNGGGR